MPVEVPTLWRVAKSSSAALSCGLPLRIAHAISPPVRTATSSCTVSCGKICFQKSALCLLTTMSGIEAGVEHLEQILVLQRLGGFLECHRRFLFGRKLLVERDEALVIARRFAHEDFLAGEIVQLAIFGEAGPDTTTSLTLARPAAVKSTSFWRSGVIVRLAAAMSPLPAASAGSSWSRRTGMKTTRTFRFLFLSFFSAASFLLSSSSNSRTYQRRCRAARPCR